MNNNNFKKIQILGNTQVSGYFAYCRLVNYDNMAQTKIVKNLTKNNPVMLYDKRDISGSFLNVVNSNDIITNNNIGFSIVAAGKQTSSSTSEPYIFKNDLLDPFTVFAIPYDSTFLRYVSGSYTLFESSNKSYSKYLLLSKGGVFYCSKSSVDIFRSYINLQAPAYSVALIDFCISTNVPLVMEYLGEIEVMQSDNNNKVNNSYFIINRYEENLL